MFGVGLCFSVPAEATPLTLGSPHLTGPAHQPPGVGSPGNHSTALHLKLDSPGRWSCCVRKTTFCLSHLCLSLCKNTHL